jgi:23S rRNA-/tRNA-specific pseudouridylate synthase
MNSAKRGSAAQLAVNILYLEQHFLVINKPPTVYSQPNWYTENPKEHEAALTVEELLKQQYPELYKPVREPFCPPKLVHRLDYNTTGAMILATSKRAAKMFAKGFQSRGGFKVRKFVRGMLHMVS